MKTAVEQVQEAYEQIFSLPIEQQTDALHKWWAALTGSCSDEHPCIECQAQEYLESQA